MYFHQLAFLIVAFSSVAMCDVERLCSLENVTHFLQNTYATVKKGDKLDIKTLPQDCENQYNLTVTFMGNVSRMNTTDFSPFTRHICNNFEKANKCIRIIIKDVVGCKDTDLIYPPHERLFYYMMSGYPTIIHKINFRELYFLADAVLAVAREACGTKPFSLLTTPGALEAAQCVSNSFDAIFGRRYYQGSPDTDLRRLNSLVDLQIMATKLMAIDLNMDGKPLKEHQCQSLAEVLGGLNKMFTHSSCEQLKTQIAKAGSTLVKNLCATVPVSLSSAADDNSVISIWLMLTGAIASHLW
ncbi:PREDICTED: uncharacterized protein LOC106806073 [Priapulus caudatus]|uniref:Uncharacterized protein LOC106806073 n=1 Tax=Priapulus caudatus TaxID=37621 RepID=A0ABM1DTY9_PRICU|nr:PREDICTED: uncharacterized protein LOC106806073 [Priapulus caudatus]